MSAFRKTIDCVAEPLIVLNWHEPVNSEHQIPGSLPGTHTHTHITHYVLHLRRCCWTDTLRVTSICWCFCVAAVLPWSCIGHTITRAGAPLCCSFMPCTHREGNLLHCTSETHFPTSQIVTFWIMYSHMFARRHTAPANMWR